MYRFTLHMTNPMQVEAHHLVEVQTQQSPTLKMSSQFSRRIPYGIISVQEGMPSILLVNALTPMNCGVRLSLGPTALPTPESWGMGEAATTVTPTRLARTSVKNLAIAVVVVS